MERKEPTLSGSNNNSNSSEREDLSSRSSAPDYDEPRKSRSSPNSIPAQSSSPLAAVALVFALAGVGGAGYLGWMLTQAQAALMKADGRITQLENQLNVTSTDSAASLGSLQVNIKAVDADVKNLKEAVRKNSADTNEKFVGVNKNIESSKREIADLKGDSTSLKQDALAYKAGQEETSLRLETQEKAIVEQRKRVQDVAASVAAVLNQVKSAEGLASRINTAEEAIDAIDDNRRNINRDLAQIKQQLGIKN